MLWLAKVSTQDLPRPCSSKIIAYTDWQDTWNPEKLLRGNSDVK